MLYYIFSNAFYFIYVYWEKPLVFQSAQAPGLQKHFCSTEKQHKELLMGKY